MTHRRADHVVVLPLQRATRWSEPAISVVVPTRNEAGNVAVLLDRLEQALRGRRAEVLFVDDSDDETPQAVSRAAATSPLDIRLFHRPAGERHGGLGGAVVHGLAAGRAPWVVVMDGDLQHPPELVPDLVAEGDLQDADVVVASRYCPKGEQLGLAGPLRIAVSGAATAATKAVFPRHLRGVSDPMTGFFAVRRDRIDLDSLRPCGFKILLELLVRGGRSHVVEVPFRFASRHSGTSKASLREGLRFVRLLAQLALSVLLSRPLTVARLRRAAAFGVVGLSGLVVNSALLHLLVSGGLGLHYVPAATLATSAALIWNFLWTEIWVFAGPKPFTVGRRLLRFTALNGLTLLAHLPLLVTLTSLLGVHYLLANVLATGLVFVAKFLLSDRLVYRSRGFVTLVRTSGEDAPKTTARTAVSA